MENGIEDRKGKKNMKDSCFKEYRSWAEDVTLKIREKMAWCSEKNRDKIPYTTGKGRDYDDRSDLEKEWSHDDGLNWWTNGFWGGIMWLLYQDTGEEKYARIARISEYRLERCFEDYLGLHHDVGFMYLLSAVADYRLTGNERSRKTGLHAANLLAGRFNLAGRFIRAWNEVPGDDTTGWAIIDCMMNICLLYWASEETGDPRFRQIAMAHADTAMKCFLRSDGSVNHIVEFDPVTGEMVRSLGGQGYGEGSSWTRGQGWAVYGFVLSYIHTGKQEYLDAAKRVAHYCIANIPETGIIPVDFRQPEEPAWEDSCGACVIACGLLELARQVPELEQAMYAKAAVKILKAIDEHRADWSRDCDAIVQNCSASYHNKEHHVTMNYADYFFMEAIYKLTGTGRLLW